MASGIAEPASLLSRVSEELGLTALYNTSLDVKLLCLQRFVRLFAYGASTLILVAYLETLGISKTQIGLFMTLTLAGDLCISFFLTLFADALGRKATGSEIGPFRAIEESIVAHLTQPRDRAHVYAWYSLGGSVGTAFGMLTGGLVTDRLVNVLRWNKVMSYRVIFQIYATVGLLKTILALLLSSRVEIDEQFEQAQADNTADETAPLLNGTNSPQETQIPKTKSRLRSLLPAISKQSVSVVFELCLLFAVDSFASGLATISWLTYFFHTQFNIDEGRLGTIFLATSLVTAASMLVAASLAKRFGNIIIMVATHLPSSICLSIIPLFNELHWSLVFLIIRACTHAMDTPPRAAFLAKIILPGERTAVMGTINVIRTSSQTLGPLITGVLADKKLLWVSFVIAGALKAVYDIGLWVMFRNKEGRREQTEEQRTEEDQFHANESSNPVGS
ncbi:hypothetical protein AB5N19_07907 [Seiridium cardinale]